MIRRMSGKFCWLDVGPVFSGRSADSIFGRQHTRSRINKSYLLAYLHTMALSFFISLSVTYTDIANRQTTHIFFRFSRDSFVRCAQTKSKRERKREKQRHDGMSQNGFLAVIWTFAFNSVEPSDNSRLPIISPAEGGRAATACKSAVRSPRRPLSSASCVSL